MDTSSNTNLKADVSDNATDGDNNPYFKTYLRNHKDIKLPAKFGKSKNANESDRLGQSQNRTDYDTLSKVKLFTIQNVLSPSDCSTLIELTSKLGYVPISFEYPEEYRKCERVICKSFELASIVWNKIIPYFQRNDIEGIRPYGFGNDGIWRPTHINEAIRFTRYRDGDFFKPHRDGGYTKSNLNRSVYTIMIYLNDASAGDFGGGDTVFYALPATKCKDSGDPQNEDLFLSEADKNSALQVRITPMQGMCAIFNHDVWHQGDIVHTPSADKYKFILRSDIMFECYSCETFDRKKLIHDPLYIKAQYLYKRTIELQNTGDVRESTISYLKALSIQTTLPSVVVDKDDTYYGAELHWFSNDVYEYIFSFLDVYRLITVSYVSRAWYFYATSPTLWKLAYAKYFNLDEVPTSSSSSSDDDDTMQLHSDNHAAYNALFRPWKHVFSYRVMVKNEFPIIALNVWLNGIEIGSTAKKKQKESTTTTTTQDHDQSLMNENAAQYIPFATAEYRETNNWSWKPHRKEILYGRIIYAGGELTTGAYGFRAPAWCVDEAGVLDGLRFHKLLKQILYFPNVVLSLPAIMYDNKLFMLYLKYAFTKFNTQKMTKVFSLNIKNMEQEIAKFYHANNCVVVVHEHRSFSVSVIRNGQRLVHDAALMKKYIAYKAEKRNYIESDPQPQPQSHEEEEEEQEDPKRLFFPTGYYHYRDDYDSNFFITNISNFDFVASLKQQNVKKLKQSASQQKMQSEAKPDLERYRWSARSFKFFNKSTTAPEAVVIEDDNNAETEQKNASEESANHYLDVSATRTEPQQQLLQKMKTFMHSEALKEKLETKGDAQLLASLVNDMYVGPNAGSDIPHNDDFKHLTNRWDERVQPQKQKRNFEYYNANNAPFNQTLSYSPFDLITAVHDIVHECQRQNIFVQDNVEEKSETIPVILVGPLSNFYGDFVAEFCAMHNEEHQKNGNGFGVKFMKEYVNNDGTTNVSDRSSALKHVLQTVVAPQEISSFMPIANIQNEIIEFVKSDEKASEIQTEKTEKQPQKKSKSEKAKWWKFGTK